jgi:hypothetical protein
MRSLLAAEVPYSLTIFTCPLLAVSCIYSHNLPSAHQLSHRHKLLRSQSFRENVRLLCVGVDFGQQDSGAITNVTLEEAIFDSNMLGTRRIFMASSAVVIAPLAIVFKPS